MNRRSSFGIPATIDVQGVLGTFKVPDSNLTVEYILTYAPLDGGQTANGQLLDLLVPVREVFDLKDLDFDHLLQRDLDDFRVSEEMVPYLLGKNSSDPRFFPPIVAVIVPMTGKDMKAYYPQCSEENEKDGDFLLKVSKYGNIFSVKREKLGERLAQSPVDLCIHPTNAKLIIVDGQHRAMAMLAIYRSALNRWKGNEFQHFYQIDEEIELSDLDQIHLPVCIAYFPELTEDIQTTAERDLTMACRKLFLDVNRNARHPSRAREILLDDTDIVACFTRHLFNMVKNNIKTANLQLHHTEYDNPHDQIPISRPFAITTVYTIFNIIRSVLLMDDKRVRNPLTQYATGRPPRNSQRLQRELDLENVLTEEEKDRLDIEISEIKQDDYPRQAEGSLRQCFEGVWGQAMVNSLSKFYPFSKHIEAVNTVLEHHKSYRGVTQIAHTALIEGQGLRHTLDRQQQHDRDHKRSDKKTDAQEAWEALQTIEADFEKCRAKLYLQLSSDPNADEINEVNRLFDCFRSSAFQNGLFMAFACLKDRMRIDDKQEFVQSVDKWITYINNKFQDITGVRTILFNHSHPNSLRYIYRPTGGLNPSDGYFFRYLILELLGDQKGVEEKIIEEAKKGWQPKLYEMLYKRKERELSSEEDEESDIQKRLELLSFREIVDAYKNSLDIGKEEIEINLQEVRKRISQYVSEIEDEDEIDEAEDPSEEQ